MGLEENVVEIDNTKDHACQMWTLCTHAFYDLTHVSPVVFLFLLKECYFYGTCKATAKFRALQHQVYLVLHNDPKPGPATFIVQCLYLSPLFEDHGQGFTHLIISALRRFLKRATTLEDSLEVKDLAAHLLLDIIRGQIYHDEKIVMKLLEIFDVKLINIEKAMCQIKEKDYLSCGTAKEFVEQYIFELVESQLYMTAVTLIEHFSILHYGQSFLLDMIQSNQFKAAEKWATFMGKPMLSILVGEYIERNMLKDAYETIKKNNLKQDFPDVYKRCKESSLKNLAEKGCWDVAEARTNNDRQLMEYLEMLRPIPVALASCTRFFEAMSAMRESFATLQNLRVGHFDSPVPRTPARDPSQRLPGVSDVVTPPPWKNEASFDDLAIRNLRGQELNQQVEDVDSEVGQIHQDNGTSNRRLSWPPSVKKSVT